MRRTIKILNIIAGILIVLQVMGYLGSKKPVGLTGEELTAYYIGYNCLLIVAVILLLINFFLKRKLKHEKEEDIVDSIGKPDDERSSLRIK